MSRREDTGLGARGTASASCLTYSERNLHGGQWLATADDKTVMVLERKKEGNKKKSLARRLRESAVNEESGKKGGKTGNGASVAKLIGVEEAGRPAPKDRDLERGAGAGHWLSCRWL